MKIVICVLVVSFFLLGPCCGLTAAESSVIGTWQLISDSPKGDHFTWKLIVAEEQGQLAGRLLGGPPPSEYVVHEPKAGGNRFTFWFEVMGETYTVDATISGSTFDGIWKGGGAQGFMKGEKLTRAER